MGFIDTYKKAKQYDMAVQNNHNNKVAGLEQQVADSDTKLASMQGYTDGMAKELGNSLSAQLAHKNALESIVDHTFKNGSNASVNELLNNPKYSEHLGDVESKLTDRSNGLSAQLANLLS